jgi:hypothetical protein
MSATFLLPALVTLIACVVGVARADVDTPDWRALQAGGIATIVVGVLIATWRGEGVEDGSFWSGVILGPFIVALFPLYLYYALGRWLARRTVVLCLVWVASVPALYFYLLLGFVFTAELVNCGPDAYECPF